MWQTYFCVNMYVCVHVYMFLYSHVHGRNEYGGKRIDCESFLLNVIHFFYLTVLPTILALALSSQ